MCGTSEARNDYQLMSIITDKITVIYLHLKLILLLVFPRSLFTDKSLEKKMLNDFLGKVLMLENVRV